MDPVIKKMDFIKPTFTAKDMMLSSPTFRRHTLGAASKSDWQKKHLESSSIVLPYWPKHAVI